MNNNYPEIAQKLLRNKIQDTSDPIVAPRIIYKTNKIMKFLEKQDILMDRYIVEYVSDLSELGYMMMKEVIRGGVPVDLNIDTSNYCYDLSISGYTEEGSYPYSANMKEESNDLIAIRQTEYDIIYIFKNTDFMGVKVKGKGLITV